MALTGQVSSSGISISQPSQTLQLVQRLQQVPDKRTLLMSKVHTELRRGAQLWRPWTRFRPLRRRPWPPLPPRTGADTLHITILIGGLCTRCTLKCMRQHFVSPR